AVQHVAFTHEWPAPRQFFECGKIGLRLAREADHGIDLNLEPELARVELGVVAADQPDFLERAYPAQAGRGRDADATGQFDIGHPSVSLELRENPVVDWIELWGRHQYLWVKCLAAD